MITQAVTRKVYFGLHLFCFLCIIPWDWDPSRKKLFKMKNPLLQYLNYCICLGVPGTFLYFSFMFGVDVWLNTVLETYRHNFPDDNALNRNIQSLTVDEVNEMKIDLIAMSPPCQPFCRTGLKLDVQDPRTDSFRHLLRILPDIQFRYLLLENVKGFEDSDAHQLLIETLKKCNFHWQEFLLTPTTLGIPNSRLRYYMIAKSRDISWCFQPTPESIILSEIPLWGSPISEVPYGNIVTSENETWSSRRKKRFLEELTINDNIPIPIPEVWCVGDVIENFEAETNSKYFVPPTTVEKYEKAMDVVNLCSVQTCCFTKSYGQYVKGTGSIFDQSNDNSNGANGKCPKYRFFTPREISRLMCYPDSFTFPSTMSYKQKCKSLGNSINVYVVAILMTLLLKDLNK